MNIYYAVLAAILTGAAVAVAVYVVLTLAELRKTLSEVDALVNKANAEMEKVQNITSAVSGVAGAVGGSVGKTVVSIASVLFRAAKHFRRERASVPADEEEDDE